MSGKAKKTDTSSSEKKWTSIVSIMIGRFIHTLSCSQHVHWLYCKMKYSLAAIVRRF
jgi:hypothetical protein